MSGRTPIPIAPRFSSDCPPRPLTQRSLDGGPGDRLETAVIASERDEGVVDPRSFDRGPLRRVYLLERRYSRQMPLPAVPALGFLGPFTGPPVVIGVLLVLLLILVVGRIIVGVAWRLVLIAFLVVFGLWLLDVLGTGLSVIG